MSKWPAQLTGFSFGKVLSGFVKFLEGSILVYYFFYVITCFLYFLFLFVVFSLKNFNKFKIMFPFFQEHAKKIQKIKNIFLITFIIFLNVSVSEKMFIFKK